MTRKFNFDLGEEETRRAGIQIMALPQRMEQFSRAYVHAIAAVAGANVLEWKVDDDSIDVGFGIRTKRRARLEAQLKCTYAHEMNDKGLAFPLELKNYDDLRADTLVPRILVVLVVPRDPARWLEQTPEQLVLHRCAWWVSLRGAAESDNKGNVTVTLSSERVFTPAALLELLEAGGAS